MSDLLHVVFGTGPAGCWTARALVAVGHRVRAINRSGRRPDLMPREVEMLAVTDAGDAAAASQAAKGATAIYQCLNPPYHRWPELFPPLQRSLMTAARETGARYVSLENLYMYNAGSEPISESSREVQSTKKGRVRAAMGQELLDAHRRGEIRVAIGRASDFFGPGVRASQLGERALGNLVQGKPANVTGNPDIPHAFAFIADVGRGLAALGTSDAALGRIWMLPHAPACTQRELLQVAAQCVGRPLKLRAMGSLMMRLGGLFIPEARETVEMMYQFTQPFVVDASRIEQELGVKATATARAIEDTMAWWAEAAGQGSR